MPGKKKQFYISHMGFLYLLAVNIRLAYVYCGNGHDNGVLNLFLELC